MANAQAKAASKQSHKPQKLARLPKHARVQKRPLLHPAIPSPYTSASQQKVVYISSRTPFISAVKRVRKLLEQVDKRAVGAVDLVEGSGNDKQKLRQLEKQVDAARKGGAEGGKREKKKEEVVLKATGRSIERALEFGLFFQGQDDLNVRLRTGTVGTVDDIVVVSGDEGEGEDGEGDKEGEEGEVEKQDEEVPEARVRFTNSSDQGGFQVVHRLRADGNADHGSVDALGEKPGGASLAVILTVSKSIERD
ncbi:uncharacterized protein KY384_001146 [Bacidia gigantensis]|uniref:uncharacterized protein n=1 Tax=Bacidia gigantensis TaxID=2732470 RepID=UPI001D03ACAB|nr:uncharacterized protein KY384_001146 [Bacidia gigantensis]KAG8534302.1 hypothetical protein KY384_001146 [Bacidia gigantensis]